MDRQQALDLIKSKVKNKNLIKHMLATEVVMRELAKKFGEDEDLWALAGLVHDLDVEETANDFSQHGLITAKVLEEKEFPSEIIQAVKAHAEKAEPVSLMDKILKAVDPMTGFIVACALMVNTEGSKLQALDVGFALRRFKEKHFARGASREQMKKCEEFQMSLEEFLDCGIKAMQSISDELGL